MAKSPKYPFAVIGRSVSRYSVPLKEIERWEVQSIGRESPTRLYKNAVKPERYRYDTHWERAAAIGRFATQEDAEAFVASAKAHLAALVAARDEALLEARVAEEKLRATRRMVNEGAATWLAAQPVSA